MRNNRSNVGRSCRCLPRRRLKGQAIPIDIRSLLPAPYRDALSMSCEACRENHTRCTNALLNTSLALIDQP